MGTMQNFMHTAKEEAKARTIVYFFGSESDTHTQKMKMETLFIIILNIAIIFLYNFYYIVVPFCV